MSASDHLQSAQFHPDEIGFLKSRDFPGQIRDIEFAPGGEHDERVREIMKTAATQGIVEPIEVRGPSYGGKPYLHDGHHRYVAAKRLGLKTIPVVGY